MIEVVKEHSRPIPAWAQDLVSRLGTNPYGGPLWRIIWAPEVMEIIGGQWSDGIREYRHVPRYDFERYILERWCPPSQYGSPEEWNQMVDAWGFHPCGAQYPFRGAYEHFHTFEANGEFVPLDPTLVRLIVSAIEQNKLRKVSDRKRSLQEVKERQQREFERIFDDIYDDSKNVFWGATVGYGGRSDNKIDNVRLDRTAKDLPAKMRQAHGGLTQL